MRIVPAGGAELLEAVTAPELLVSPGLLGSAPLAIEVRQAGDHGLSPPAMLTL